MIAKVREGYKQTEVGVIPEDWGVERLCNGIQLLSGHHVIAHFCNTEGIGIPYLTGPADFQQGNIQHSKYTANPSTLCRKDDILVTVKGSGAGKMVLADSEYCISRQLMAIRVIDWDVHFLFSLLKQDESLFGAAAIGLIPGLSRMDILNKFIPLPQKMQEQTAIATALSDTDALIASLEKLIEKKRAIKLGAMQELLKPKEGWLVRRLGDCLIGTPNYGINAAAVAYSDILPTYIRITDISEDGRFCLENMRSVDSPFSGNYILDEGDIVFARTGASVGKTYLYNKSDGLLVFAGFLIRIKVNPKILNPFYLQNYTTTREYWNWVKVMSMRSGQPGINGNEFSQLEVPVPPSILEQNRIATILNDMDTNISTLEQKLSKYKLLKQGMMQELLTGKTRLV